MTLNETTLLKDMLCVLLSLIGSEARVPIPYQTLYPSLSMPEPLLGATFF